MMDMLLAPKFASSCDTLVDAFVKRAKTVYGAGASEAS
jgi:ribosome-associated toxin RatA of RatAB toxin-antitoxin module